MAQRRIKRVVEDDDYGDDEEMKDAPVWAKALYRRLNSDNGGNRAHDRSDDETDDDEGTERQTKDKPKPNRKHWLLG